ncbi:hypothetical protein CROQUDRAFT_683440 [Cronartium quercuum f. sp. fusiforme G11]|uniref:glycogenin glucosyltransferase n=1 Tax=Cronartium quercuum f. sp. fusiforme G11 TaxID=708437 RepID=A0A9P6N9D2_9BASI|nr:hypothetical protein CROQUDRAFT_683440 [Cronartium quercuum f. sp. fusiforme G11]
MAPNAFVTMLTSDSYLPGALVTAHSIKQSEQFNESQDFDLVCLITLESVTAESIKGLRKVFNLVISVDELRSFGKDELNLLGRQDLSGTITKIHIWRLVQYQRIIYVDADTLILKPISHLFQVPNKFSACPDTGWPDCFNSGLMVIHPSLEVFDQLYNLFMERGSWDGGDQGLLNEFFRGEGSFEDEGTPPTWNRLSFTYNVTPSAYYSYAPAYKRFGDRISLIHFIGREKPWHLFSQRQFKTRTHPGSSNALPAVDYDTLVSKWFDVYERAYGPIKSADPSHMEHDFKFPKYAAEWDNRRPSRYEPPSVDKLKEIFTRRTGDLNSVPLLHHNDAHGSEVEGSYMSMPLPGRPHLFLDQYGYQTRADKGKGTERRSSHESLPVSDLLPEPYHSDPGAFDHHTKSTEKSETVTGRPVDETLSPGPKPPVDASSHDSHHDHFNPQAYHHREDHVWDASRAPPPAQGFQMNDPITKRYEAAWDQPAKQQSAGFFQPPPLQRGFIPSITHQDYSQIAANSPDLKFVKPVFPWEQNSGASRDRKTSRIFPEDRPQTPDREPRERGASYNSDAFSDDLHLHQHTHQPSIDQANLTELYRNAWDEHPFIRRYADALSGGSHHSRVGSETDARKSLVTQLAQTPHLERKSYFSSGQFENDRWMSGGVISDAAASFRIRRDSETSSRDGDEEDVGSEDEGSDDGIGQPNQAPKIDTMPVNVPDKALVSGLAGRRPQFFHGNESVGSVSRIPTVRSIIIGVPVGVAENVGAGETESVKKGDTKATEKTNLGTAIENETPRLNPRTEVPTSKPSRVFSAATDTGSFKQSGLNALQKLINEMENQKRSAAAGQNLVRSPSS